MTTDDIALLEDTMLAAQNLLGIDRACKDVGLCLKPPPQDEIYALKPIKQCEAVCLWRNWNSDIRQKFYITFKKMIIEEDTGLDGQKKYK